jgi:hypothetical protein
LFFISLSSVLLFSRKAQAAVSRITERRYSTHAMCSSAATPGRRAWFRKVPRLSHEVSGTFFVSRTISELRTCRRINNAAVNIDWLKSGEHYLLSRFQYLPSRFQFARGTEDRSKALQEESKHAIGNQESAMSSSEGPAPRQVVPAQQARQGVTGHNVRRVLGFSIAAVIIIFAIIWIVYFA